MPASAIFNPPLDVRSAPLGYGREMPSIEPLNTQETERAVRVAGGIYTAWHAWLGALPHACRSASGLSRELGVDRTTCQRLVHAVRGEFSGPALLARIPGIPGLRRLLEAGRPRVPEPIAARADAAVDAFAELIDELAGSQARLIRRLDATGADAELTPTSSESDTADRQRLFEAAARLTGRWSDLWTAVYLFIPDAKRERMRVPRTYGLLGHRATPDAVPLIIQSFGIGAVRQANANAAGLVEAFSTDARSLRSIQDSGELLAQRIDTEPDAPPDPIDLVFASVGDNPHPRVCESRVANLWAMIHFPAKAMLLDAYIHVSEARATLPSVSNHLWGPDMDLLARPSWKTRFQSSPKLQVLGRGLAGATSPLHRRHTELTRLTFESAGVHPDEFVGYRLEVPYPNWRTGYCICFDYEDEPSAANPA